MLRFSSLVLTATIFCVALTAVLQGQDPEGGRQGGRGQQAAALPDGAGKETVQAMCSACHGVNLITGSTGYSRERWQDLVSTMIKLPDAQAATVSQYLATHFPPKPGREPVLVPGPTTVTFKEWVVPTLGQRSRDPLQLADGTIYWAGQYGSLVGRLNPRTGEMKEWKLAPAARPHSIINDPQATSGTRATETARSASSIPRPARSPSSRCPIRTRAILTRRSLPRTGRLCGSPCSRAT